MPEQGLGSIADYVKKRKEAQDAAEGKPSAPVQGLQKAAPPKPQPEPEPAPVKPVDYKPIKDKTPEEKKKLQEEMAAELAVRARRAQKK